LQNEQCPPHPLPLPRRGEGKGEGAYSTKKRSGREKDESEFASPGKKRQRISRRRDGPDGIDALSLARMTEGFPPPQPFPSKSISANLNIPSPSPFHGPGREGRDREGMG